MTTKRNRQKAFFIEVAERLADGRLRETDLPAAMKALPQLDTMLLESVAAAAEWEGPRRPRRGWAIAAVAAAAARHTADPRLMALADWYLSRAANEWTRPARVEQAARRARERFTALDEPVWAAACDWQLNALPWTRPQFQEAAQALAAAHTTLVDAGWEQQAAQCGVSVAFGYTLYGEFERAREINEQSRRYFAAQGDHFWLGRCLLTESGYLRRQSRFAQAARCLDEAHTLFMVVEAPVYVAMVLMTQALMTWMQEGDHTRARALFLEAIAAFERADLPLWYAQSYNTLTSIEMGQGNLTTAGDYLQKARDVYVRYQIAGLSGENLLHLAIWEKFRGHFQQSLAYLHDAIGLFQEIGNDWVALNADLEMGDVLFRMGRYQQALFKLENALQLYQEWDIPQRVAEVGLLLVRAWLFLGQPQQADDYLGIISDYFQTSEQGIQLPDLHNLQAAVLFALADDGDNRDQEALAILEKGLRIAREQGDRIQIGIAQRYLGEGLLRIGRPAAAQEAVEAAVALFADAGAIGAQTAVQITLGELFHQLGRSREADAAWRRALELSGGLQPEYDWRAYAGLGALAVERGDPAGGLRHYRRALTALTQLRQGLWQAPLIGSFMSRRASLLERAAALAVAYGHGEDLLDFIEAGKGSLITRRILVESPPDTLLSAREAKLRNTEAEIRWLQERIRVDFRDQQGWLRPAEEVRLRRQLAEKIETYAAQQDQAQRGDIPQHFGDHSFDVAAFRRQAAARLGSGWTAVNFALTDEALYGVLLTDDVCHGWSVPVPPQLQLSLHLLAQQRQRGDGLQERDLLLLGEWLLTAVRAHLSPDSPLIIAPSGLLHQLPWAALPVDGAPLALRSVPVVVPSLHSLQALWQQGAAPAPPLANGLLLSVTDFSDRHEPLPGVREEVAAIAGYFADGRTLQESAAAWPRLAALAADGGLQQFSCLHIATHAFADTRSGRLSGLALYDRDVWLDDLRELAPLPPLVVLSACNGGQSLVVGGDEQVGLLPTLLAVGARQVVSTLWQVEDEAASRFMADFYDRLAAGAAPAAALAAVQRAWWRQGERYADWAGFFSVGWI